jgi:DNA-directed RNA polymerase subunit RPC12/RpoP
MKFEHRCLVELSDILAIQYECARCHAATIVPVENIPTPQQLLMKYVEKTCPYCQTEWGMDRNTSEFEKFTQFNSLLREIAEKMKGRNLTLRLEIKCPEKP